MNSANHTPDEVQMASRYYLRLAQKCAKALGLPDFSGDENDDALHDIADVAFDRFSRCPVAEQLGADLFAYRLVRDTGDLQCTDTTEHRRRLIAEAIAAL